MTFFVKIPEKPKITVSVKYKINNSVEMIAKAFTNPEEAKDFIDDRMGDYYSQVDKNIHA